MWGLWEHMSSAHKHRSWAHLWLSPVVCLECMLLSSPHVVWSFSAPSLSLSGPGSSLLATA